MPLLDPDAASDNSSLAEKKPPDPGMTCAQDAERPHVGPQIQIQIQERRSRHDKVGHEPCFVISFHFIERKETRRNVALLQIGTNLTRLVFEASRPVMKRVCTVDSFLASHRVFFCEFTNVDATPTSCVTWPHCTKVLRSTVRPTVLFFFCSLHVLVGFLQVPLVHPTVRRHAG